MGGEANYARFGIYRRSCIENTGRAGGRENGQNTRK